MSSYSAPRCGGGNGRPPHRGVYMRYAGPEGAAAVHRCPVCSSKALDGMIQPASDLPVHVPKPEPPVVVERRIYVPQPYRESSSGPGPGTVAAVCVGAFLFGAWLATRD